MPKVSVRDEPSRTFPAAIEARARLEAAGWKLRFRWKDPAGFRWVYSKKNVRHLNGSRVLVSVSAKGQVSCGTTVINTGQASMSVDQVLNGRWPWAMTREVRARFLGKT